MRFTAGLEGTDRGRGHHCGGHEWLGDGGVWLNVGLAVFLPEVFLKSLSIAQSLGYKVDGFITANFDMTQHYRPLANVVKRPTLGKGRY